MASNYTTSDGIDLDSRYLGIKAKAESAKSADFASRASVADSTATGMPIGSYSPYNADYSNKSAYTETKKITIAVGNGFVLTGIHHGLSSENTASDFILTTVIKHNGTVLVSDTKNSRRGVAVSYSDDGLSLFNSGTLEFEFKGTTDKWDFRHSYSVTGYKLK